MPRNKVKPNMAWLSQACTIVAMKIPELSCIKEDFHINYRFFAFTSRKIQMFVCLFELGPGPTYGIAYIPKMVSPSSVLHTPLLTNNPSSPKPINTCSNESAGMRHV